MSKIAIKESRDLDRRGFIAGGAALTGAACVAAAAAPAWAAEAGGEAPAEEQDNQAEAFGTPAVAGYQCSGDWLGEPPAIDPSQIVATYEAEVVVCGTGNAGTQCALAAAQGGASVIALEKMSDDAYYCNGGVIANFNSKALTDLGFGGYDLGEVTAEFCRRGGPTTHQALIRSYVENSGEMFDNIVAVTPESSDLWNYDPETGTCQVVTGYGAGDASYYPMELGGFKTWASAVDTLMRKTPGPILDRTEPVDRLTEVALYCREEAKRLGAQWFYDMDCTVLVQDEDGAVTGVIAKGPDGYVQFNATKGVVLATGDFTRNPAMVANLLGFMNEEAMRQGVSPEDMVPARGSACDGAGHKMGCWAGGAIECPPRGSMATIMGNPGPWGTSPFLMLNCQGKRFMNEALTPTVKLTIMHQPLGRICTITDASYFETVKVAGADHGAPYFGAVIDLDGPTTRMQSDMAALQPGPDGGAVQSSFSYRDMPQTVYAADTIDELLDYLGYEGEAKEQALASIEEYNESCHAGVDAQFGKDAKAMLPVETPPFYGAFKENAGTTTSGLVTFAGLVTDDDMNVLLADGSAPIKGLYAIGNCLGGRLPNGYNVPVTGASVGMAMTHGRVLGKYLAAL